MIVHLKSGYVVRGHHGQHLGGPYRDREDAERRLRQVEFFKTHPARRRGRKNPLGSGFGAGLLVGAAVLGTIWGVTYYLANKKEAPRTLAEAGRATWIKWHAQARSYVPANASAFQQMILDDIQALPCPICVNHAMGYVAANPIDLSSQAGLRKWLCDFHNAVNSRVGKPLFDCAQA